MLAKLLGQLWVFHSGRYFASLLVFVEECAIRPNDCAMVCGLIFDTTLDTYVIQVIDVDRPPCSIPLAEEYDGILTGETPGTGVENHVNYDFDITTLRTSDEFLSRGAATQCSRRKL
jgi:hypothetical protein